MQVGKPEAAQSLGKQLMTTGFSIGIFNSVLAGALPVLAAPPATQS